MILLPSAVTLSKRVTDKFRYIRSKTGVTNNILARIAISLALESDQSVEDANREDSAGQSLDKDLLFGDLAPIYEIAIREYMLDNDVELSVGGTISSLVEIGAHKMSHIRSLEHFASLS